MNTFAIKERAAKVADRACYATTVVVVAAAIAVIFTGKPHVEYRVSFGNAEAAQTIRLAPTQEELSALGRASLDDGRKIEAAKRGDPSEITRFNCP
jgi:hypothetical protein